MKLKDKTVIRAILILVLTWSGFAVAETPTEVSIAVILATGPDEPWDGTLWEAVKRLEGQTIDGVTLSKIAYTDAVWGDAAQAAMRLYARKYDIVWAHTTFSDQVKKIMHKFPDTMFVVVGSGNEYLGGNSYLVYNRIYEPAYTLGIIAGMETKTNMLGAVAGFAADDVNDVVNAFFAGAKSVNPNIKHKVAFIDSWWDPPLAFEASSAQIAAGVDQMVMLSGAYEGCIKAKITCYGSYRDWYDFAPDVVGGSMVANWEPHLKWAIKEWKKAKESGQWNGNKELVEFLMIDGAAEMALGEYPHDPAAVAAAQEVVDKIKSGEFVVPLDVSTPISN